jgi:hypothetical protein
MVVKVENNAGDMAQKLRIRKRNEYVSSFWIRNKGKSVLFPEDGLPLVENLFEHEGCGVRWRPERNILADKDFSLLMGIL